MEWASGLGLGMLTMSLLSDSGKFSPKASHPTMQAKGSNVRLWVSGRRLLGTVGDEYPVTTASQDPALTGLAAALPLPW